MSNLTIQQALDDIRAADIALESALKAVLPVGTQVYWESSGFRQYGHVERNVTDRVEVTNFYTEKTYLLHAYRFTPEYGGGVVELTKSA